MTPIVQLYADVGARQAITQIGLTPEQFAPIQPRINESVARQTLEFCQDTLNQTELAINEAYNQVKQELASGLLEGNTRVEMTRRIQEVFDTLTTETAHNIAVTESSRAQHGAVIQTAQESDLVEGMRFLLTSDACPKCVKVNEEWGNKIIPFGTNISGNTYTADTMGVPIHTNCRCVMQPVLKP